MRRPQGATVEVEVGFPLEWQAIGLKWEARVVTIAVKGLAWERR